MFIPDQTEFDDMTTEFVLKRIVVPQTCRAGSELLARPK